jgi:hypothetical protein
VTDGQHSDERLDGRDDERAVALVVEGGDMCRRQ